MIGRWAAGLGLALVLVATGLWLCGREPVRGPSPSTSSPNHSIAKAERPREPRPTYEASRVHTNHGRALEPDATTGEDLELTPAQLAVLELPAETLMQVWEEDVAMVVELCLEGHEDPSSIEGLALDVVLEAKAGEAVVDDVRFRDESHDKPDELPGCALALLGIGAVPLEIADLFEDRVYTLRLGKNRVADISSPRRGQPRQRAGSGPGGGGRGAAPSR